MEQQKALIYAFVARGNVILAEFTDLCGNFNSIAFQCLQKLPASNNKFTHNCDGHTFNYLVHDGFTYCVVAEESVEGQVPITFLERVKDDFVSKYGGGKAATAAPDSLNKEFGPKLKEHMHYWADHPEEISKLAKVKAQVSEVKGVMMENIEKVLDRGEKIELLVDKTENLHHQFEIYPSDMRICWGRDARYWKLPQEPRGPAELVEVSWLDVAGCCDKVKPDVTYNVRFKVKLTRKAFGWNIPLYFMAKSGKRSIWKKLILTKDNNVEEDGTYLVPKILSVKADDKKLCFGLYEVWSGQWKGGLVIQKVIIEREDN